LIEKKNTKQIKATSGITE